MRRGLHLAVAVTGGLGAAALVVATGVLGPRIVGIGTGFYAKQLCSGVFVSRRAAADVAQRDLSVYSPAIVMRNIAWRVDEHDQTVRAEWHGIAPRLAKHRPGYGCALVFDAAPTPMPEVSPRAPSNADEPWPQGDRVGDASALPETSRARLAEAIDAAFAPGTSTRAVVIVHRGRIVAERYSEGIGPDTPLPGWSMAKSVVNALVGALVQGGRLSLDAPLDFPAWRVDAADPRARITFRDALGMTTGLAFDETYANPLSDVTRMLFESPDVAAFAAMRPLRDAPGSTWAYTSGTTNLVSAALRERLGAVAYARSPAREIFARIGMASAVFEADSAGTFVGSSFLYATARDWARFGLLFARGGVWSGERILPEGWVRYSRTPAPHSDGRYGAHFWLGLEDAKGTPPATDADAFHAAGHAGQRVVVVPSREIVIVRLAADVGVPRFDARSFAERVLAALPQ